jgi:hypothetical protein
MSTRFLLAVCLVIPLGVASYAAAILPSLYAAALLGLIQLVVYVPLAVNVWLCRDCVGGRRVLAGMLSVLGVLSCGILWLLSWLSPPMPPPPGAYGVVVIGVPIVAVQAAIAFLAGYVSCICADARERQGQANQ